MTIDVPTASLAAAIAVVGWFLVRLTVFDAIRRLERGAADQGKRIGDLESWTEAHDKVEDYKARRSLSRAHGVPVQSEEDITP